MATRHLTDINVSGDVTINGSHLKLLNHSGSYEGASTDYLYIGGSGLDGADAAIYLGNAGNDSGYGWRFYYEGTGSGNNNKLIFKSENAGSGVDALSFTQDGNCTFSGTISTASHGSSTNWKQAYDNHITGIAVTGTSTKTITLTQRDGGTISADFSDQSGSGGITMTNGVNNRVVTATGIGAVNGESGLLFGGSYLEITPGNIATPLQIKRTSASTRQVNLLLSANDGSSTSEGFLGIDSGADLRYGGSSNTSLNSLVLTEDNTDFVVNSSTNSAIIRLAGGGTNFTSFSVGGEGDAVTISSTSSSLTVGLREFIEEKYIYTSNDSNAVYMPMVKGGMYGTSASSVTGQILIKIPSYKTNMMQQFYVDIYEYETGESMTFRVSGYNYNDTNGTWYNTSVVNLSDDTDRDFTVRFGADTTNGFQYVAIGETNSTWSYPQVNVRDFYGGYATSEADTQGSFNVSFVTTTPGSTSQTHTNNYVAGDYNNLKNKPTIPTVNNGQLTVQGTGALGGSGTFTANQSGNTTISISHDDTSSQGSVDNSNGTVIQDVTLDGYGHVTALGSVNLDSRYYTESESDNRFVNVTGDTMTGNLNIGANLSLTGDSRILNLAGGSTTSSQSRVIVGEQGLYGVSFRWNSGAELEFDGFWNSSVTGSRNRDLGSIDVNNRVWYLNNNVTVGGTLTTPNLTIGSGNKIKFANNDFIRFDDANGVGRFHFDCDGSTNNASVQAATFVGALSGNATTSTTLATARTIAGSSFDGSADIDISYNNLTNTPTIPTVNNATLTVQGTGALGGSGTFTANQSSNATISISHDDTSSQSSVNNSSGTVIQDVTLDGYGHVTSLGSVNLDGRYYTESEIQTFFNRGYISKHSASNLAVGWYTIATNTGDRALGEFQIWDTASGDHQSVLFNATHHYGRDASNDITVLANSRYSGTNFRYIRIKENGTYDGAAVQVYIDGTSNAVNVALVGANAQTSGWVIKDWVADATDPGDVSSWSNFVERCKVDLDNIIDGGIVTTGEIYSGGATTQYRVLNTADEGSGNGLDADQLDGQHGSYYLDYNNFTNTPSSGGISQSDADTRYINATGDTMGGTLNMAGNTLTLHTSGGSPGLKSYYGTVNVVNGSSAGTLYVGTGSANASGSVYATTIGGGSNTKVVYSTSHHRYYVGSSTEEMRLESDGDLHVEGDVTAYSTTVSDIRLKDNVVTINNALDKVCKLRGVEYTWNKGSRKDTRDLGVIAQEVEKVLPEIVKEKKMPLIDDSDTTYKSVDYEKITAVLVEAVKEQQAQIDELTTILEEVTKQLNNGNNV